MTWVMPSSVDFISQIFWFGKKGLSSKEHMTLWSLASSRQGFPIEEQKKSKALFLLWFV
jgi:hypothetical protein